MPLVAFVVFYCLIGAIRCDGVIRRGLWRGGTRRRRDVERAEGRRPQFRGYRHAVEYVEVRAATPRYLGYAPRAVRRAFVSMVVMPWLWPVAYAIDAFSLLLPMDLWSSSDVGESLFAFEVGLAVAFLPLFAVFWRARRVFVDCDLRAARCWGRGAGVFAGGVAVAMTMPPILHLMAFAGTLEDLSLPWFIIVSGLGLATLAEAIRLGYTSSHLPTDWDDTGADLRSRGST